MSDMAGGDAELEELLERKLDLCEELARVTARIHELEGREPEADDPRRALHPRALVEGHRRTGSAVYLLHALERALLFHESLPWVVRHWLRDACQSYTRSLSAMQSGAATPGLGELLGLPTPSKPGTMPPAVRRFFTDQRDQVVTERLAFYLCCFESMTFDEAAGLVAEEGWSMGARRGADLAGALTTAAAVGKVAGSRAGVLETYSHRFVGWGLARTEAMLEQGGLPEPRRQELRFRILAPEFAGPH